MVTRKLLHVQPFAAKIVITRRTWQGNGSNRRKKKGDKDADEKEAKYGPWWAGFNTAEQQLCDDRTLPRSRSHIHFIKIIYRRKIFTYFHLWASLFTPVG
jgi:hypothetical protein